MAVGRYTQKIATCCYCGTRAALVLDQTRHELSCASCGAPLHDLKMLPKSTAQDPAPAPVTPRQKPKSTHPKQPHPRPKKTKKRSKRKGLWRKVAEEIWDEIEDIFD